MIFGIIFECLKGNIIVKKWFKVIMISVKMEVVMDKVMEKCKSLYVIIFRMLLN